MRAKRSSSRRVGANQHPTLFVGRNFDLNDRQIDMVAVGRAHVDRVVLLVAASNSDEKDQPAEESELLLVADRSKEVEGVPVALEVLAALLRDAVHVDLDRLLGSRGKRDL